MEFTTNTHERFGAVRTAVMDGKPWIVACDLCSVLGYTTPAALTKSLEADEKRTFREGCVSYICINRLGFYHACLNSDSPEAKPLMRWMTNKVLPEAVPSCGNVLEVADEAMSLMRTLHTFISENIGIILAAAQMRDAIKEGVLSEIGGERAEEGA